MTHEDIPALLRDIAECDNSALVVRQRAGGRRYQVTQTQDLGERLRLIWIAEHLETFARILEMQGS